MPELPEVETIKRGLEKSILGQRILNIEIRNEKIISSHSNIRKASKIKTESFIRNLIDKKIVNVFRRAKNIILELSDVQSNNKYDNVCSAIILIHLKMTGQLIYNGITTKHTHIIFTLEKGNLLYNDIRQFGYVLYYKDISEAVANGHFEKLGLEPFDEDFTLIYLKDKLAKTNKNIKSTLLSQAIVVGIGNIYADEICFVSNISPHRICKTLNDKEINSLYKNINNILALAIERGGSSISDYKLVNGESGRYHLCHQVYGRSGLACYKCKTILTKSIIAGRSSVWCENCQK